MVYLPTFTIQINQLQVKIPYMDPMDIGNNCYSLWTPWDTICVHAIHVIVHC